MTIPQRRAPGFPARYRVRHATPVRAPDRADAGQGERRACPTGDGWLFEPKWDGFRALVFRDGDEVYTQSRDLKPLDRYFPELAAPFRAQLPERCVLDGEVVIARDGSLDFEALLLRIHPAASRVRMLAAETPASFVAWDLLALGDEDLRAVPAGRAPGAPRGRPRRSVTPPVHLTPATRDRALAADWFDRFEGAGLDGVVAKRLDGAYQPGKRAMLKIKHERTADCVVAGFRWHKNGPGTHVGSRCCSACSTTRASSTTSGSRRRSRWERRAALVGELAPLREGALDGHPWAEWAEWAAMGAADASGPAAARRDVALEPRQGPVVGAAARGARRRGRLRPPPGRPLPPRDDVPPLAPGQAARGLPLRPARDDHARTSWSGSSAADSRRLTRVRPRGRRDACHGAMRTRMTSHRGWPAAMLGP